MITTEIHPDNWMGTRRKLTLFEGHWNHEFSVIDNLIHATGEGAMKLLYCPSCLNIKKLRMMEFRTCACGKSWGYYLENGLAAEIDCLAAPIASQSRP